MEGVLHKRGRGKTALNINGSWTERIVQVTYEERVLKYYDTSLLLKGSLVLGNDLEVRLVDSKEVEGRPNAFEVSSGEEKIVFSSIMPSGAEKWFSFLKNFNKLIDQKVIKEERIKQLDWVDGVVKSVQNNFEGNPIALRLNLQDLLKTNVTLTKSVDESKLICAADVNQELRDLATEVRTHYMKTINDALALIKADSLAIMAKITTLVFQLSEAALLHATTSGISTRFVGSEKGSNEVILGVAMTGPLLCGNVAALQAWVDKIYSGLRLVLTHFITGKSFHDKVFSEYAAAIELAGLSFASPEIVALLAEIRLAAAIAPVSLDESVASFQLAAFDDKFMKQYCVRAALALCGRFEPHALLESVVLVETSASNAALWEAEVAVTAESETTALELGEEGIPTQRIKLVQIYPPPPPEPEPELEVDPELEADPEAEAAAEAAVELEPLGEEA